VSELPPFAHGGAADRPPRDPARTLRRFALAAVALLLLGFGAGALFGRVDPARAARLVVAEYTVTEDGPPDAPGPDPQLPVTGPDRGVPVCGQHRGPLDPSTQVATLAAGVVLVQHRTELPDGAEQVLAQLAARDRVAVAPTPALDGEDGPVVVATSWRHRMPLDRVDADLLGSFVTGHADRAPAVTDCP
jgi:hypothetical protein